MTVVTTRPNATVTSAGTSVTGAASRHAATNDDSDSSYVTIGPDEATILGFVEPTIPAGGLVKSISARARCAAPGAPQAIYVQLFTDGGAGSGELGVFNGASLVSWGTPTTISLDASPAAWSATPTDAQAVVSVPVHSGASVRMHELFLDTVYVAKPVTAPSAPTGTVTNTNLPTVAWVNTLDGDGGAQTHYQVRVFTDAQYGAGGFDPASSTATYDSGDVASSALSHQVATLLADATYRAYVRVGQTVNGVTHWSDYAYTGFVISVALPAVPDSPVLTAEPASGRIKVHVEGNSGTATTTHLEVQRSEDGTTWEPLRLTTDTDGLLAGTSADVYDYEAPNGAVMSYRVRALHNYSGLYAASAWATVATGSWSSAAAWLKAPESPGLNMVIEPDSVPGYQRPARQGTFQPLGRTDQVVVADTRGAPRGTLKISVASSSDRADLDALLDSNLTLLLQFPLAEDEPDRYLRFGDQDRQRWIDKAFATPRIDTLSWFEVAVPNGVVDAWPT